MKALLAASGVALLLGACGQKGPLYLPDEGGEVIVRPAPSGQEKEEDKAKTVTRPQSTESK